MSLKEKKPICEAKGITKEFYGSNHHVLGVLDKIDIQVYPNEILAIIGPSGCGKSTLIRILAGLVPATHGQIIYHGKRISGLLPNFSLVFQNFALFPWMTVKQNIEIVLKTLDLSKEEIEKRTREAIALIGLAGFEEAYPREISGGMKQRVGLARALVRQPEILLLDEPFSSLDAFTGEMLRRELLNIWENQEKGPRAIVIISHDIREVVFLADRIIMMEANPGRIRLMIENTLPRPRDYHSAEFIQLVDQLHDAYSEPRPLAPQPVLPLIPATTEEVLGLLSYLHQHNKINDLYHIGTGVMDRFGQVLMNAKTAELLHFVKIAKRTVTLLDAGKKFMAADHRAKRLIWQEQLMALPLFQKALEWLKSAPKRQLSYKELSDLISKELPLSDAKEQCRILINWGSYGNLFVHHRLSKAISLKKEIL